jgi:hypothetical protein
MSRKPCHFFSTPKGCRFGENCSFSHNNRSSSPVPSPSNGTAPQQGHSPQPHSKAPPGICNFYWRTGVCNREFACRFRHTKENTTAHDSQVLQRNATSSAFDAIAPYLTEAGLAKVAGTGTDIFFSIPDNPISPEEAHNHLKKFLYDTYHFNSTFEVYAFLRILTSATSTNSSWVC